MSSLTSSFDRLDLILTFVRIAEAGSLTAAARQLSLTQPTASRRLQALERLMGVRLVRRTTHQLQLTEEGVRLFHQAKELLENWGRLESATKGTREEPSGLLRVQVPHALGQDQLIPHLTKYMTAYPNVTIEWLLKDPLPDFVGEHIDCAIIAGSVKDPSVVATRIGEIRRTVVVAPSLLGMLPKIKHPRDLADQPWLALTTFYNDRVTLFSGSKKETVRIQPRLKTDSLYVLRRAALNGLGIGLCSRWIIEEDLKAKRLVALVGDWEGDPLPVHLVYPQNRYQPAKLKKFIEIIRKQQGRLM